MNNYYLIINDQKKGPYTETRIKNMWENKHIDPGTECLKEGETDPRPIEEFPEITSPTATAKPEATAATTIKPSTSPAATTTSSTSVDIQSNATPEASPTAIWKFILVLLVGVGIGGLLISQLGGKTIVSGEDANATAPKKGSDTNATAPQKGADANPTKTRKGN